MVIKSKVHRVTIEKGSPDEPKLKDENYCWFILSASFLINFTADGVAYAFGIFLSKISLDFPEVGKSGVAWIVCIMTAITHAAGPIGSILINKFGWRIVSIIGSLLAGIGFIVSYWTPDVWTMYATIGVLGGFGFTLLFLPAMLSVPEYFNKRRSFAVGVTVAGCGIGTFFYSWIFGLILSVCTWRQGLLIIGLIIFTTSSLAFVYPTHNPASIHKIQTSERIIKNTEDASSDCANVDKTGKQLLDLTLLRDWSLLIFLLADLVTTMGYHVPYVYLPEIEHKLTASDSNSILIMMSGANVLGRILFGYLSDKRWIHRLFLYMTCLLVAGVVTIVSPHVESILWLQIIWTLYGVCMGLTSLKLAILVDLVGLEKMTDSLGLCLLFEAAGFLIGAPIVGFSYDKFGSYKYGFYFVGLMVVLSTGMVSFIPRLQKRSTMKMVKKSPPWSVPLQTTNNTMTAKPQAPHIVLIPLTTQDPFIGI